MNATRRPPSPGPSTIPRFAATASREFAAARRVGSPTRLGTAAIDPARKGVEATAVRKRDAEEQPQRIDQGQDQEEGRAGQVGGDHRALAVPAVRDVAAERTQQPDRPDRQQDGQRHGHGRSARAREDQVDERRVRGHRSDDGDQPRQGQATDGGVGRGPRLVSGRHRGSLRRVVDVLPVTSALGGQTVVGDGQERDDDVAPRRLARVEDGQVALGGVDGVGEDHVDGGVVGRDVRVDVALERRLVDADVQAEDPGPAPGPRRRRARRS